jgi:hypothetical protein
MGYLQGMRFLSLLVLLSVSLAACVAPQTRALRKQMAVTPPAAPVELADVPFFPQDDHQCGPAALATLLSYTGDTVTPAVLAPEVYVPDRKGSFAMGMVAAARRHGRVVYPLHESLDSVLAALDAHIPVLVMQNNGLSFYPIWHFAVVVGADRAHENFILRSGRTQRLVESFSTFEYTWARSGYWAALVLDPATLNDGLDPDETLRQLAALEDGGATEAAQAGYWRASLNWPDEKFAWFGLANTSVKLKQWDKAEAAFHELLRRHPSYPAGLNNYADFLVRQGRPREALPLAEHAVKLLDNDVTEKTLASAWKAIDGTVLPTSTSGLITP